MQKLRKLTFFDRQVVKEEGLDIHPGVQKLRVDFADGGSQHLWFGTSAGEVQRLDRQYVLSPPYQLFEQELHGLKVLDQRQLLFLLGADAKGRTERSPVIKYKIYDIKGEGEPVLQSSNRLLPARMVEQAVTCFDVTAPAHMMAVGGDTGFVVLLRSRDLTRDRVSTIELAGDGDMAISSVHFLEQPRRVVLFACNATTVRSWSCEDSVRLLNMDTSGGADPRCSAIFPSTNSLLAARSEAIFAHDPDEGNMSAIPMEYRKHMLVQYKSYFVLVSSDADSAMGAAGGGMAAAASAPVGLGTPAVSKQIVSVFLLYPQMRFVAYSAPFTDVTHVFPGLDRLFVLSRGSSADSNTVLFELKEKDMAEQIDILVKKRMFEWAAEVGLRDGASPDVVADIYRQHGDALFEKRAYDQALAVYCKTVELGLPLEPSYIVERYLVAQRIGHMARYLKKLHEHNMAEREHTALLLKCYTKLRDLSTLQDFLGTVSPSQYDPSVAIEVLETAGYFELAADIAKKVGQHDDFIRISLKHFSDYGKILEFIPSLGIADASCRLVRHGGVLMRHAPAETAALARQLCESWCSAVEAGQITVPESSSDGEVAHVEDFLAIFVDNESAMESFLKDLLLDPEGPKFRPADAQRLFPTLLELMLRRLHLASKASTEAADLASLHKDAMWLIQQYSTEDCLISTLMLCQTYEFVDGFLFAAEKLGRFQLLMNWCFAQKDVPRLLEVCKRCGTIDQSLWVQALSFLAKDDGDHTEELQEVLHHIEQSDLVPLLMVIETLQQNPRITLDNMRSYLCGQFEKLASSVSTSRSRSLDDRQEILRMQQEVVSLQTTAQIFQNTRCFTCKLTLEVPAVHFFCGHSYHAYCLPVDSRCPSCSVQALDKMSRRELGEAKALNTEEFFKQVQGGVGEAGIQAIGEWCRFGAFDAGRELPQDM